MRKPVYAIAAVARGRVIGRSGRLPWSFPEDAAYFAAMTLGGVMIEGPGCYEELGGALPGRDTVVISRDATRVFPGARRAGTLGEALDVAESSSYPGPVWISGGQWLYEVAAPLCEKLFLTEILTDVVGDRFFPEWKETHPRLLSSRAEVFSGTALVFSVYSKK